MSVTEAQFNIWGEAEDPFVSAVERYGVWPTTVWDCDLSDPTTRSLKALIGDNGEARAEVFTKASEDKSVFRGKVTTTIFNPAVAAWLLNCYAPRQGVVYDPFAGGGTRAIVAGASGLDYYGLELREEEVRASTARVFNAGLSDGVSIQHGNALAPPPLPPADVLLTCPPYWNMEQYDGGPDDLSMAPTYELFLDMLATVVDQSTTVLKNGAKALWVVGLHRDKFGGLLPLHHDLAAIHTTLGFRFKEEIVLAQRNNGAIQRVGNFEKGDKRLVRMHEYALVFDWPGRA